MCYACTLHTPYVYAPRLSFPLGLASALELEKQPKDRESDEEHRARPRSTRAGADAELTGGGERDESLDHVRQLRKCEDAHPIRAPTEERKRYVGERRRECEERSEGEDATKGKEGNGLGEGGDWWPIQPRCQPRRELVGGGRLGARRQRHGEPTLFACVAAAEDAFELDAVGAQSDEPRLASAEAHLPPSQREQRRRVALVCFGKGLGRHLSIEENGEHKKRTGKGGTQSIFNLEFFF